MSELVILVLGATWAAVLVPPLLRSRIENRPNSSITDFRRQLNKLQNTVPTRASGPMRGVARPLTQSPAYRPAATGRPGQAGAQARRQGSRSHGDRTPPRGMPVTQTADPARRRTHGDPTGGQRRPAPHRQAHLARQNAAPVPASLASRRRSNVMFVLVLSTAATLFLAADTKSPAMLYLFAFSFLALCGYGYLLTQARQRDTESWPNDWMHNEREQRRAYR